MLQRNVGGNVGNLYGVGQGRWAVIDGVLVVRRPVPKSKAMQEQCSCKVVIRREKFKAVSIHCLGLLESYDLREDNKIGMN